VEPILGPLLTLIGVTAGVYFTYRVSTRKLKSDSGQQMIDQHQEENAELRKQIAALQKQTRIQGDYIGQLRKHIADGQPPPPPAWPNGLIT
jgi:ribosomal protein S4